MSSVILYAFQMTPELIAEINQALSMDVGILGVIYAGTGLHPAHEAPSGDSWQGILSQQPSPKLNYSMLTLSRKIASLIGPPSDHPAFILTVIADFNKPCCGRLSIKPSHLLSLLQFPVWFGRVQGVAEPQMAPMVWFGAAPEPEPQIVVQFGLVWVWTKVRN
ncbi:hypothetical protein EI94DRAFT_1701265 [Lactarius quietus]|nr:hypothetical protein EI94DRAFT_1701265 [Lactarius quietus]